MASINRVHEAVNNEEWQSFRRSLKGISTRDKLEKLCEYYLDNAPHISSFDLEPCGDCDICIRVDNYIKALCRGGQLYAGENLLKMIEQQFHRGTKIKRN